jgi:hypothetical protein
MLAVAAELRAAVDPAGTGAPHRVLRHFDIVCAYA